jgi:hypothetical protein
MLSRHLLYDLSLCWTILALNIPQHAVQQPLLLSDQHSNQAQSRAVNVTLGFIERGVNIERHFEIPLRSRISAGTLLTCMEDSNISY